MITTWSGDTLTLETVREREAALVQFLKDQMELGDAPIYYDPIIRTREERITVGAGTRIDGFVKLEGGQGLRIGRYVHIASFAHIGIGGGTTIIEDFAAIASGGKVISGSNQTDALSMSAVAPPGMQKIVGGVTQIRRYACVLTNAVVTPGVTLNEGAVLAAGAVAIEDIPAWEIWGGVPARHLRDRLVRCDGCGDRVKPLGSPQCIGAENCLGRGVGL